MGEPGIARRFPPLPVALSVTLILIGPQRCLYRWLALAKLPRVVPPLPSGKWLKLPRFKLAVLEVAHGKAGYLYMAFN